jgi:hypothetical protein
MSLNPLPYPATLLGQPKHPTSNIQHPTSNIEQPTSNEQRKGKAEGRMQGGLQPP